MNICLIHKGKNNTSGVASYLQNSIHVVSEISLQEKGASELIKKITADVIVFDIIATKGDDDDTLILKKIQETTNAIPVLLATNSNELSKYRESMLDAGVDGCIQVPFLQEELILRLEKLAKKKDTRLFSGTKIEASNVEMDIRSHSVEAEGKKVSLTKTEYSILLHLFLHKNTIVSNRELSTCLDEEAKKDSLALNIHIFNLRKKMKGSSLIKTVPLYGFTVSNAFALR